MSRSKKLIVLLVVLVLVIAAFFGVAKWSAAQNVSENNNEETTEVIKIDTKKITSLTWTYMGGTYTVEKSDGTWVNPEDPDFEVNQDLAEYMASIISDIQAKQIITDVTDYEQYNFNNSTQTITVETEDGEGYKVVIGLQIEISGDYYAMIEGNADVYVVDLKYPYNFGCTMEEMEALSDEELEQLAESLSETTE